MAITVEHHCFENVEQARQEFEAARLHCHDVDAAPSGGTPIHWHDVGIHFYVSEGVFRFQDAANDTIHECGPGTKFVIPERTLHIEEEHHGYKGLVGLTKDPVPQPFVRPPEELPQGNA